MKLSQKRYRHNSHRMWPKSTLTHTTRRCKVRHTTQKSHLPRPAVRGICDRCERSSKRGIEGPLQQRYPLIGADRCQPLPQEKNCALATFCSRRVPALRCSRLLQPCQARGCSRPATTHRRPIGAEHKPLRCPRQRKTQTSQFMNSQAPSA